MSRLRIHQISKRLGGKSVLDRVSLDVPAGTFLSLLGPSGCGKTTLLRILAGFIAPDCGMIDLDGKALSTPEKIVPPEQRGMGMVFQNYAVWPHMTVLNNVTYGLKLRRIAARDVRTRAEEALRLVGLAGFGNRLPSELSGGQQQRVAIARSIATEPNVLLLDEPLSNLDAQLRKDMLFDLKNIQQKCGITFIYVTHDQSEALSVSDQIAVMQGGRVEQVGSPRAIYDEPLTRFVAAFVGNANIIHGIIESCDSSTVAVALRPSGRLLLSDCPPLAPGTPVEVAIKRHGIRLSPFLPGMKDDAAGAVTRRYFLGQSEELCVDVEGTEIFGFTKPGAFSIGDRVTVDVEPGSHRIFPNASMSGCP